MAGYGLSFKPPKQLSYFRSISEELLSVGKTDSKDWCYHFGSTTVSKNKINSKPKVAAVAKFVCSDEICYRGDIFCY